MHARTLTHVAAVLAGAVLLATPALLAGHPSVFPDTSAYELVGQWLAERAGLAIHGGYGYLKHRADLGLFFTIAGARSPFYGLLLFGLAIWGSAWTVVALQALAGGALVWVTMKAMLGEARTPAFLGVVCVLTAASTLPFFVSFVMPDVFAGYAVLSALLLCFYPDRLSSHERVALVVLLAASLSFHATNPPMAALIVILGAAAAGLRLVPTRPAVAGLGLATAALLAALAAGALYAPTVSALAHRQLARPPFLTARLLADGPGRTYLRRACAADPQSWALCPFKDRPLTDANDILWHEGPTGVFEVGDLATRLAMIRQEPAFVRAVLRSDPIGVIVRLVGNSAYELTQVTVVDTLGYADTSLVSKGPRFSPPSPSATFCVRQPRYCHATRFQTGWDAAITAGVLIALGYLALRLVATGWRRLRARIAPLSPRSAAAAAAMLVVVAANGILCGAVSGVYPRYEMRMIWLIPLMAALSWLGERRGRASVDVVKASAFSAAAASTAD
ncbi:MAG TPA: hypothetical protein VG248_02650 [Caulobacteraceae bacterium]|jgi:hypothetical protein|nr:hypothetical protein [Caulobacteraceae bacterium]